MELERRLCSLVGVLCCLFVLVKATGLEFTRSDFPSSFVFGSATSAYQVEGAAYEDGRTPSIWDMFTHQGMMPDKSTGDIAADGYHKYKDDVKLMADMGLEAYRFSISWSRLIPGGTGDPNPAGLEYYNDLIDELVKHGIQVHVMLYQLDLPEILQDEYGGWMSSKIIDDFTAYADVCFREFGNRVKHWTTLAEPNIISIAGYDQGSWPPSQCSKPFGVVNCTSGNSTAEPYVVMHNLLLSHASVYNLYRNNYYTQTDPYPTWTKFISPKVTEYFCFDLDRSIIISTTIKGVLCIPPRTELAQILIGRSKSKQKYSVTSEDMDQLGPANLSHQFFNREAQKGMVGINVYSFGLLPFSDSAADLKAAQRFRDFFIGWILDPLAFGHYPSVMREAVGSRLPTFTKQQSQILNGSFDFVGLNHYMTLYVMDYSNKTKSGPRDYSADTLVRITDNRNATPGSQFTPDIRNVEPDPDGLQHMLEYLKKVYGNPPIYIQENGRGLASNSSLEDTERTEYIRSYIGGTLNAIRNGVDVRGYFVWSFIDLFEYMTGYETTFGLFSVDFNSVDLTRRPKHSAHWYSQFLKNNSTNTFVLPDGKHRSEQ